MGSKFVYYASSPRSVVDTAVSWLCKSIVRPPNPPRQILSVVPAAAHLSAHLRQHVGFVRMRGVASAIRDVKCSTSSFRFIQSYAHKVA